MKTLDKLVICFLISLFTSCDSSDNLGNDFYVNYVDVESNRNIYYKDQGIFKSLHVNFVCYNDDKILVRGYPEHLDRTIDTTKFEYYIIDKSVYSINPIQMESNGNIGPIGIGQFEIEKVNLFNAKSLSW
ncbi:MAG: hypothetical protein EOO42_09785 [Flavobacteriales bacterium]|nr:MAG: hypothetical protein EOO42_09785 [Flavobacteriales bacterium]